jgi:hypothetical protein
VVVVVVVVGVHCEQVRGHFSRKIAAISTSIPTETVA